MSWRRLRVLLDNLPSESAYCTAVRNSLPDEEVERIAESPITDYGPWSQTDMLLARIGDLVAHLMWMQSDGKTPKPDPYPRPGVPLAGVTPINEDAVAYLLEVERLHGAQPGPEWVPPSRRSQA